MNNFVWSNKISKVSFSKKKFRKGAHIYRTGEEVRGVYRILKGCVKLYRQDRESGRKITFHFREPFEIFGVVEHVLKTENRRCAALAVDAEVMVEFIPFCEFEERFLKTFEQKMALLQAFGESERQIWTKFIGLREGDITERIRKALIRMFEEKGRITKGGIILSGMSHSELADYIGASRQSVTVALNKFRREGKMEYDRDRFVLKIEI